MPRTVGVLKETFPGERCVAIVPRSVEVLKKADMEVLVEPGAGFEAGYTDDQYTAKGATLASRADILAKCDILAQFRSLGANPEAGRSDLGGMRKGQIVLGMGEPLTAVKEAADLAATEIGRAHV